MGTTLPVTLFAAPHRWSSVGRRSDASWKRLVRLADKPQLWPSDTSVQASEDRLAGILLATLRDDTRVLGTSGTVVVDETLARVEKVSGLIIEYVDEPLADEKHLRRWWKAYRVLAFTTAFHMRPMGDRPPGPRWRVFLPFTRPASVQEAQLAAEWARHPRNAVGYTSERTLEISRVAALPAIAPGGYAWFATEGEALDLHTVEADLERWDVEERAQEARRATIGATLEEAVAAFRTRLATPGRRALLPWPGAEAGLPDALEAEPAPAPELDALGAIAGSLWPGRLSVLIGPSGSGRSALALQLAESVARTGHPVLYANAGLPTDEVIARLLVLRGHDTRPPLPPSHAHVLEGQTEPDAIEAACAALVEACPQLYLWTPTTGERTDEALRQRALGVAASSDGRSPLIVVDPVEGFEEGQDLHTTLSEMSAACRDLARAGSLSEEWPGAAVLVVLSAPPDSFSTAEELAEQMVEDTPRAHLRHALTVGLGGLGIDAGLVLAMARDATPPTGPTPGVIAVIMNRHGHTGHVRVDFHGAAGVHVARSP